MKNKPEVGDAIRITIENSTGERTYEGTVLGFDGSGEFALVWWEDGTRDYRYLHQGYDVQMNETMEWD